jgi:ribonuclease HI
LVGTHLQWQGDSFDIALHSWCLTQEYKSVKALLAILAWGIWISQNKAIFQDIHVSPSIVVILAACILSHFPQEKEDLGIRNVIVEAVNKLIPWGFFDGASQGEPRRCGGGGLLYLSDSHSFELSSGLGVGTNNFVELSVVRLLLLFALERGCRSLQVFGDSMIVINWLNEIQRCHIICLCPLLEEVITLKQQFEYISFTHVYRERNLEVDRLSKAGLLLAVGHWHITKHHDGTRSIETHKNFQGNLEDVVSS